MSELSLDTLFEAINGLKTEVAGLSSSLRLAENRIARLEAATYTPLVSPLPSTEESHQASLPGSRKPSISIEEKPSILIEEKPIASTTPKLCSQEGICDIRQHLQPVTDGIAALTDHVLRIERAIGRIPTTCSTSSSDTLDKAPPTATNEELQGILEKAQEKLEISEKPSRNLLEWRNPRKDRESVGTALDASAAASRPIFGQISTPKRREMSVNVTGSPFGSYVDEKSPFSQLARKNSGQSSVLKPLSSKLDNSKSPISPFSFRASSTERSTSLSKFNLSQPSTSPPSRFTSATFSLDPQPVIFKPSSLNLLRLS